MQTQVRKRMTLAEIADILGVDDLTGPCEYDMSDLGLRVKTQDGYKGITNFAVMPEVDAHYELYGLKATSVHKVLEGDEWVEMKNHPDAQYVDERMSVVDLTVPETSSYLANDIVSHNTVPGGELTSYASLAGR